MSRRVDLSLILPCYNEAGLFTESVARIKEVLDSAKLSYEVIFVDDKSRDGTPALIREYCQNHSSFHALFHNRNMGRGKAVTDGIRVARGTAVGYIDIDCEVAPVYIPRMVTLILKNYADVVIGKRIYRTSLSSMLREVLSRGYQRLSDFMVGTGGLDTETGYKFFNRKKIVPILAKAKHPGWFWDTEIMVYSRREGLWIVEIPVLFLRRFDKHSSVNIIRDTADYLINLWKLRARVRT